MRRNPARLADWFRELRLPLLKYLARRHRVAGADLDDLAQEVFLRLLRYDRAEFVAEPRGYLFRIATNVAHDWSKRAVERLPHDATWLAELLTESQPDGDLEQEQRSRCVEAALLRLAPRSREILRLHFGEELKYEAIATALSITPRIVKREIVRAYATLREELDFEATDAVGRSGARLGRKS
jgi:RNA polymerase sigma factor (sigma-70 family)